ncbi:MAG: M48 family metallopeptidase [Pseudomonadota bacterium]|nr:M48 family metallopeptidase [Pseudomonadota bacterium]
MAWGRVAAGAAGAGPVVTEGYSQDDIRNGFRTAELPSSPLGDRLKMGCAAISSLLIPLLLLVLLLLVTGIWLNLTWVAVASGKPVSSLGVALLLSGDLFLFGFIAALARRLLLIRRNAKSHLEVSTEQQPELYAFINHIAGMLGAPRPKRVKLDAEVGLILRPASWRDAISGEGPEVIIGLPLLYGLSARQLSGVIAHGYAGYSREARLGGYPLLSSVDRWLFNQTGLGRMAAAGRVRSASGLRALLDKLLRPWDLLVQGTFYLIYRLISATTFEVSRNVDMAGDLLSARVAGSTEFRSTQFRLRSLHYGQINANQELMGSWRSKRLSDNFPALVVDHADTLQLSLRPRLIQEMEELVTPLTRSRIVDLGRIVNVEHTQEEGACFLLGAAIALLRDPARVSKAVTLAHYRYLGIQHPDIYSTQKVQSLQKAEREKARRHQVFLGLERSGRIVRVDEFEPYLATAPESRLVDYRRLGQTLQQNEMDIGHLADGVREYEFRKNMLQIRKALEECKVDNGAVLRELEVQWLSLIKEQSELKARLAPFEAAFSRRCAIGFCVALDSEAVQQQLQMSRHELSAHFTRVVEALSFLHRSYESLQRLRTYTQVCGQLLVELGADHRPDPVVFEMSHRYQRYMMIELDALIRVFRGVANPLGGIDLGVPPAAVPSPAAEINLLSVADVVRMRVPDLESAGSSAQACHRVANAVCQYMDTFNEQIQQRVTGILVAVDRAYSSAESPAPR